MTQSNVIQCIKSAWQSVFKHVKNSVVFIDNTLAESLHWVGGASLLVQSGSVDIKQFSSFESGTKDQKKAVFLVSQPICGTVEQILTDILCDSHFENVIVFTSVPAVLHSTARYGEGDDENKTFHNIKELLLDCMGNPNYHVDVVYLPVVYAPVTSELFMMSGYHDVFPLSAHEWLKTSSQDGVTHDGSLLPQHCQRSIKLLTYAINGALELLDVSDDVYCLGDTSRLVATELASLTVAKQRRKTSQKKASIVLVDRTVDLASALGHHSSTLLDKITAVRNRLPGHYNDVMVNMAHLCNVNSSFDDVILPGCLAHNTDLNARELFSSFVTAKQKESLLELKIALEEAAQRENIDMTSQRADQSTVDYIQSCVSAFKGKQNQVRQQAGILQLASAVQQTLRDPALVHYDSLLGIEKGLLQELAADHGMTSSFRQILQLFENYVDTPEEQRRHSLSNLLGLLSFLYSLFNNRDCIEPEIENNLKTLLVRCLLETSQNRLPACIQNKIADNSSLPDVVTELVSDIMQTLTSLTSARQSLRHFRQVYSEGSETSPACLTPLLVQLVDEVFAGGSDEVPDLEYKSTGLRDLLKSGFRLFMNVSKPRPNDHPLLILFVVGGVTSSEVKLIKDTVAQYDSKTQVLVGSTQLLTPDDLLHKIFTSHDSHDATQS